MSDLTLSAPSQPWHAGERTMQHLAGVPEEVSRRAGAAIRHHLIDQHREFYPLLSFVVLGTVDGRGYPWATVRAGRPGFLHSPDPHTLLVDASRDPADPADEGMAHGDAIGLLGIDLATRRRNRLNGIVERDSSDQFAIAVRQSFGNCPRFIHRRRFRFVRDPATPSPDAPVETVGLSEAGRSMVAAADTFFVATAVETDGVATADVSHRGGPPGFVRVGADGTLTIPDYAGNRFFNTLGNLLVSPKAGLVFVDFDRGDLLQLTGEVEILFNSGELAAFPGAERLWRFRPSRSVLRQGALPLRWAEEVATH